MTDHDLLLWALEHYFGPTEIERAKAILDKEGMGAAVEYLRKLAADSWRGRCGPNQPGYDTRNGRIELKSPGTPIGAEPDLSYDIKWFAKRKLESLFQGRLL